MRGEWNLPLYRYLVARVPKYFDIVQELGEDFFENAPYISVGRLYDLATKACETNDVATVRAALDVVEEALESCDPAVVDPFSINFIEALYYDRRKPHYECLRRLLGPASLRDLKSKASG